MASSKIIELTPTNTCTMCENAVGNYCCPRCNLLICSVACYQSSKHLQCSESFYKDCVKDQVDGADPKNKEKMMELLLKYSKRDVDSEDEDPSLEATDEEDEDLNSDDDDEALKDLKERMAKVNLDNSEEVWKNLNNDERQEFEAFLMSGDVSKLIPKWTPWWEYRCEEKVVDLEELNKNKSLCPKTFDTIETVAESESSPASYIPYNMMNVLAAYVFVLRYFNGDHMDFPKESSSYIYNLSLNLSKNQNFESFTEAVQSVTTAWTAKAALGIVVDEENMNHVGPDVQMILKGPHATEQKYYLLCAFSDLHRLFDKALNVDESSEGQFYQTFTEKQTSHIQLLSVVELEKSMKQFQYFLSYVKFCYTDD